MSLGRELLRAAGWRRPLALLALLTAGPVILLAFPDPEGTTPEQAARPDQAPAQAQPPADPPDAKGSAASNPTLELWGKKCAPCHGKQGRPTATGSMIGARDLAAATSPPLTPETIALTIRNGRGRMQGYAEELTSKQIDALVKHVLALRQQPSGEEAGVPSPRP